MSKQASAGSEKSENRQKESRLNLLYIFLTLKNFSSKEHPLSISEIRDKANSTFFDNGISIKLNTSTISRLLEPFRTNENFSFLSEGDAADYSDPQRLGYNIFCVAKENDTFIPYEDAEAKYAGKDARLMRYYYCESVFSDAELRTLLDAIAVNNYFSPGDIATLTAKLLGLNPQFTMAHRPSATDDAEIKDESSMLLNNIEDFDRMIKKKQVAEIIYYNYGYNGSSRLEALPRSNYPRIIRPVKMMWSNGFYYLVAMLGPSPQYAPSNLRMDRIQICDVLDSPKLWKAYAPPEQPSSSVYRLKNPVMYGGKEETIHMLCRQSEYNGMMNAVMDTFGTLAHCRPATQEELEQYLGYGTRYQPNPDPKEEGTWIHVRVNSTARGVVLFATQYCNHCRVISPQSLADDIKKKLTEGSLFYQ